jgi:Tol biopolymer transport system component
VSFDGRWVAYIAPRPEDGEDAVWLARTDGTAARQVFTTSGELLSRPAPSPDGSRIAFQATDAATGSSMIWIVNANGSGARAITTEAHAAPFVHTMPAWSSDGATLALALGAPGNLGIATMSADGGPLTVRTQPASGSDAEPFWSPDGARLVYVHTTTPAQSDIMLLTLAGGARQSLHAGNAHDPAWSPGGGLIAFSERTAGEPAELFTIPASGGTPFRVTTNQVADRHPNWVRRPSS